MAWRRLLDNAAHDSACATSSDEVVAQVLVRYADRDHRLRAHFPLPAPVVGSDAECAFAVVHRGLTHEGNPVEAGLPTYPARRFVDCAPLALIFDGVGEYEVLDGGRELALTLLRSVGFLSRDDGRLRQVHADPLLPTPRAEQLGPFRRALVVRMVRPTDEAGHASIRWNGVPARGWLVELTGRPLAELDGGLALEPWQIATVRIDGP